MLYGGTYHGRGGESRELTSQVISKVAIVHLELGEAISQKLPAVLSPSQCYAHKGIVSMPEYQSLTNLAAVGDVEIFPSHVL